MKTKGMESNLRINEVKELYGLFTDLFEKDVKPYIEKKFPRNKYTQPVYYIMDNFTLRRFRSGLPIIIAEHIGISKEKILPITAASELMFCIALVQDDFFDNSSVRGNMESSHKRYSARVAMASADYSYTFVIKILEELSSIDLKEGTVKNIYESFLEIQEKVFESFIIELLNKDNPNFTLTNVLNLHKAKTIHGVNTIYSTGLICDDLKSTNISKLLKEYSVNLAIAGQIKNDVYDLTRYAKTRGYTDLLNRYTNYPLAKLFDISNTKESQRIRNLFDKGKALEIVDILKQKKVFNLCIEDCSEYVERALSLIKGKFDEDLTKVLKLWAEGNRINKDSVLSDPQ